MQAISPSTKRQRYDAPFQAEALRLAEQSYQTQADARALNINSKLLYKRQKEALTPVAAARGAELDQTTAAELHQLRALARWQAQQLAILKKAASSYEPLSLHGDAAQALSHAPALAGTGHINQRISD